MKTAVAFVVFFVHLSVRSSFGDSFGSDTYTFSMDFVTIDNPGNAADNTGSPNPAGSVSYVYRIGQFEISEQMVEKANMLGGLSITKNNRGPDKPATSIIWSEAARFVNWLNTSTGHPPAYKFAFQPGQAGYNVEAENQLWQPVDAGYDASNRYRNRLAKYFLPSTDEWYKAAYYDPAPAVYYDYPTGSDDVPDGIDFVGDPDFDAVFSQGGTNPVPNDITNVGRVSPYGTAGQGGNVWEISETEIDGINDLSTRRRDNRGGGWNADSGYLASTVRGRIPGAAIDVAWGFRVASSSIPEPSTLHLALVAGSWFCRRPRRKGLEIRVPRTKALREIK